MKIRKCLYDLCFFFYFSSNIDEKSLVVEVIDCELLFLVDIR